MNLLLGAIAVVVSAGVLDSLSETAVLLKAVGVVAALNAAANAFNDYTDLETDRINRADRPLPRGTVTPESALWSSVLVFGAGIGVSAFLNYQAFIIATVVAMPLMVSYSLWLKGLPLVGNIAVAFILGLAFIFAGAAFGDLWSMLTAALLAFGFTLIRELLKDVADIEGDKKENLKTFPVRFGIRASIRLTVVFILLLCLGALIPYWIGIYGKLYLLVLALGIEIPLGFVVFFLVRFPSTKTCKTSARVLKVCIFAGLLAVWVG